MYISYAIFISIDYKKYMPMQDFCWCDVALFKHRINLEMQFVNGKSIVTLHITLLIA